VAPGLSTDYLRNMSSSETDKFDPSRRRLCPDGACVGLLDDSGRCKECGKTASGVVEPRSEPVWDEAESEGAEVVELAPPSEDAGEGVSAASGGFDPKRKLCSDGACVGVIGADGRCKVCGQAG
jgi:hypothetical protein